MLDSARFHSWEKHFSFHFCFLNWFRLLDNQNWASNVKKVFSPFQEVNCLPNFPFLFSIAVFTPYLRTLHLHPQIHVTRRISTNGLLSRIGFKLSGVYSMSGKWCKPWQSIYQPVKSHDIARPKFEFSGICVLPFPDHSEIVPKEIEPKKNKFEKT